jgi:hypothetical protein
MTIAEKKRLIFFTFVRLRQLSIPGKTRIASTGRLERQSRPQCARRAERPYIAAPLAPVCCSASSVGCQPGQVRRVRRARSIEPAGVTMLLHSIDDQQGCAAEGPQEEGCTSSAAATSEACFWAAYESDPGSQLKPDVLERQDMAEQGPSIEQYQTGGIRQVSEPISA